MEIKILTITLLIIGILGMGIYISYLQANPIIEEKLIEDNSAMLNVEVYDWAYNLDDPTEMFFDYYVYNYGNTEAKNINVECKLVDATDTNYKIVKTAVGNFGNLASNSRDFDEIVTDMITDNTDERVYSAYCYVKSCDNCKILHKNIPELIEIYEEDNFD